MSARTTVGFGALMVALGAAIFAFPQLDWVLWGLIGAVSIGAIAIGVRRYAPLRRTPWSLLAGAVAAMAAGDVLYGLDDTDDGWAAIASDACYAAMFPMVALGLLGLTRSSVVIADRSRALDLLTFTCAAGLALWSLVVGPVLADQGVSTSGKSIVAANALGALIITVATARLAVANRRSWTVVLLATGAAALMIGDLFFALADLGGGGWRPGNPAEGAYLLFYVAWGAAALHPSMAALTEPVEPGPTRLHGQRVALLAISLGIPPALLLWQAMTGSPRDSAMIGTASLIMLVVVMTRLTDAIGRYRRALLRERALREACATLVAATDSDTVRSAVRAAVGRLLPAGEAYEAVVVDGAPMPLPGGGDRTHLVSADALATADEGGALGATAVDRLRRHAAALVCPMSSATLVLGASRRALQTTRDAIEVLGAQATLALERIALTEAVTRRDSDRYLQAVVRNATDVVLIVDPDDRIRYASPSLTTVLGVDLRVRMTLWDLVDEAGRQQILQTVARARRSGEPEGVRDVWTLRRPDRTLVTVEATYRDLRDDRMVRGAVITMRDVTEQRRVEQALLREAILRSPGGKNRQSSSRKFD